MDPARTRKNARGADRGALSSSSTQLPRASGSSSSRPSTSSPRSFPPRARPGPPPPSTITPLSSLNPSSGATGKGSFPFQTSIPSSFPKFSSSRPIRDRPARPAPPPKAPKPENSALNLAKQILFTPLPCKATYPNLVRLDLGSLNVEGGGLLKLAGGVGWIGKEWGSQLTWLNLSGDEELGKGGEGFWDGFGLLRELIVLNVSSCKMSALPEQFASLTSLKAFVATGNEFEELDSDVVSKWTDLNSLIMSQNPLRILPASLSSLQQLSKLSASHTALNSSTLPDLSPLPHLRMLSLSHNPAITSLPRHFSTWGTGLLPTSDSANARPNNVHGAGAAGGRRGDGLEVVELGGCGLDKWEGLKGLLGPAGAGMKGLRSLGLRGCGVTKLEGYSDRMNLLLPNLQILDNTRIVERKAKRDPPPAPPAPPAVASPSPQPEPEPEPEAASLRLKSFSKRPESAQEPAPATLEEQNKKRKRKSRADGGEERQGGYGFDVKTSLSATVTGAEEEKEEERTGGGDPGGKKRKRSRKAKVDVSKLPPPPKVVVAPPPPLPAAAPVPASTRRVPAPTPAPAAAVVEPAPAPPKPVKKTETSVLKIVEVAKKGKGKKGVAGGVDLVELFGGKKKVDVGGGGDAGEGGEGGEEDVWGVGGWD